ncbi:MULTISPECIES: SPFH domain-containing protein [unclassified Lentimicrobium]|uniref:SPFH domain-containing protein n=1 Tax=unclassified Lentimicrobium TaxID=2677434 RepID=UPI00155344FF|nr:MULTISPECIES: SPFH domain-containing protein [unclassified Lentimicrobium]NPD44894.1 SPFH domain-containing protein [Lentimicrobium sp. S6]NPD83720.1 SPFH domain-containing protein [Lentimicrobium sp. L6]
MKTEKEFMPMNGYLMLFVAIALILVPIPIIVMTRLIGLVVLIIVGVFSVMGVFVVNPNESMVITLFGAYKGTVLKNGFFWANPFFTKKKISLRARNIDSDPIKVNDNVGNPIMIGIVLVWRVKETFKAAFDVDDYVQFVEIQSEAAIRKLAGDYPYDHFGDTQAEITLRSGGEVVNDMLESALKERLDIAGIEVMEARISHLAYAQEIAQAMLKRQQATAIVSARFKIVEGAVSMVKMALDQLKEEDIIDMDEEKKAAMISNLLVVLCSDKDASPIVNTGTLHH